MDTLDLNETLGPDLLRECAAQFKALQEAAVRNGVLDDEIVDFLAHPAYHLRQMMTPMLASDTEACEACGFLRAVSVCKDLNMDFLVEALQKVLASPQRHALRL